MSWEADITAESLAQRLSGCALAKHLHVFDSVDSTNAVLGALAAEGAEQGTVVLADEQTAGRGRLGREWHSPAGAGLWFSVLLTPPAAPDAGWAATVCASLGVLRGVLLASGIHPQIMWPNDLLVGGRKVCGILAEAKPVRDDGTLPLVVGIGINANLAADAFPEEFRARATSLSAVRGAPVDRLALLEATLRGMAEAYAIVGREGVGPLLQPWRMHSAMMEKPVRVDLGGRVLEGVVADVRETGALVVRLADGSREEVVAGDVTLVRLAE